MQAFKAVRFLLKSDVFLRGLSIALALAPTVAEADVLATGGAVTTNGGYVFHAFTNVGTAGDERDAGGRDFGQPPALERRRNEWSGERS